MPHGFTEDEHSRFPPALLRPRFLAGSTSPSHTSRISGRPYVPSSYRQLMNAQLAGWLNAILPYRTSSSAVQGSVPTP